MTNQAFICDAVRTPFGRYGGSLSSVRADDLGAVPLRALMERNKNVDWQAVSDVLFGCGQHADKACCLFDQHAQDLGGGCTFVGDADFQRHHVLRGVGVVGMQHVEPARGVQAQDSAQQPRVAFDQVDLRQVGTRSGGILLLHRFDPDH